MIIYYTRSPGKLNDKVFGLPTPDATYIKYLKIKFFIIKYLKLNFLFAIIFVYEV